MSGAGRLAALLFFGCLRSSVIRGRLATAVTMSAWTLCVFREKSDTV